MLDQDTIAAISTPEGMGGIAIVRLSGPDAECILSRAFRPARGFAAGRPASHRMYYGFVVDAAGSAVDEAMAAYFAGPNSYTREDVAEIHCHGGRVTAGRVLRRVLELGAYPAEPGEFTKRAFLNGRIDLAQAEAVMSMIAAGSEALEACDLLVSIGTSAAVFPAAHLPLIAVRHGADTLEINPETTPVSHLYRTVLRSPAASALAALWDRWKG